jgi:SOS response regulatory protein OraA/RecX
MPFDTDTATDTATDTHTDTDTDELDDLDEVPDFGSAGAVQYSDCDAVEAQIFAERSEDEDAARASTISMYALARRGMSSAEMTKLLLSRELGAATVANEVERLERVQLLDDLALAETLVRILQERKGLGRQAIKAELRRRSIDQSAIETALSALDGDDELARATELALKRVPQVRSLDGETARRRLSAFLMRKGYSGGVVSAAVRAALEPQSRTPRFH